MGKYKNDEDYGDWKMHSKKDDELDKSICPKCGKKKGTCPDCTCKAIKESKFEKYLIESEEKLDEGAESDARSYYSTYVKEMDAKGIKAKAFEDWLADVKKKTLASGKYPNGDFVGFLKDSKKSGIQSQAFRR